MDQTANYFHILLSSYFQIKTPYLDESTQKQPNTRKLVELPWQQTKAEMWDDLSNTLTDLCFVEAKCKAGMVYELGGDYRLALAVLPESQERIIEEREHEANVQHWTADLISYAKAWNKRRDQIELGEAVTSSEPELPTPVPSCRRWTDEEIEAECQRMSDQPNRLDRLTAFEGFVSSQCYPLIEHGKRPGFILQHAFNFVPTGPVHNAAQRMIMDITSPLLLRRWLPGAGTNPKPALLQTLEGHNSQVSCVSMTPDGSRAVSGSDDNTLRVWDLENGKCLCTLEGHSWNVNSVNITAEGNRVVSGSSDRSIRVWDTESGKCICSLEGKWDDSLSIVGAGVNVSITPDGRWAVSGRDTLHVWDLERGKCLHTLEGHTDLVLSVSVTPDGRWAISGSNDKTLRVWNLESTKCLYTLKGHTDSVTSVSMTPDWRLAVSASDDKTLRVWNLKSGSCLHTLEGHKDIVTSVSITPDGKRAISGSRDNTLRIWNLESGKCISVLEGHSWYINCVSIMADGRRAVSGGGGGDRTLRVWDLESGKNQTTMEGKENVDKRIKVNVTFDRKQVISSTISRLRVWDIESMTCLHTMEGHSDFIVNIIMITNGKRALSGSYDKTLRIWDTESGHCIHSLEGHTDKVHSLSVTPDGNRALSGSYDNSLRIWDLKDGKCLSIINGHYPLVGDTVSITPDGKRAVSYVKNGDPTLWVLDLESGKWLHTLEGHTDWIESISITPDGRRVVSSSKDKTLRVWNIENGKTLHILEGHSEGITNVSMTPDGRGVVSKSTDKTLRVWDLKSGKCISILTGHKDYISTMAILSDGRMAMSGGEALWVWDLRTGGCLGVSVFHSSLSSIAISSLHVMAGTDTGEILFLEMKNFNLASPIVTATRHWLFDQHTWDTALSVRCPLCGNSFLPDKSVLDVIDKCTTELSPDQISCLSLPPEAWEDPRLLSECSHCHKPLRFNPFKVDNKDLYSEG
jgi:WD40 repeat protein